MKKTFLLRTSLNRREFVKSLGAASVLGSLAVLAAAEAISPITAGTSSPQPDLGKDAKVKRWDVITIGNLARNRYWGESEDKAVRSTLCTCTVVQGDGFRLIVDPSVSNAEEMFRELDRRTGLKPRDITAAFVTHEHGDHWVGLAHFPEARWFAGPEIAAALNKTKKLPKPVEPATGQLFDIVEILPTPGHTPGHRSLRFSCDGKAVVIAGDAVMTRDFWREQRGYYKSVDLERATKTINAIAGLADFVVPGHDNYFLNVRP